MGYHNRNAVTGTSAKAIQVSEEVARLVELRKSGMNLKEAAELCGIPYGTAQSWIRKYIRHVSSQTIIGFRNQELETMERAQERILRIAEGYHYQFYQGQMVVMPSPDGATMPDGRPVMVPVLDTDPNVRAYMTLLKLLERKSRLMGADKPAPKIESDDPNDKQKEAGEQQMLTPAMMKLMIKALEQKTGVQMGEPQVFDIIPTERECDDPLLG